MKKFILIYVISAFSLVFSVSYEQQIVTDVARYVKMSDAQKHELLALASEQEVQAKIQNHDADIPLFRKYPKLKQYIPYIHLGSLPTRIHQCKNLGALFGKQQVYMKCDNETGGVYNDRKIFGGNKVRQLEFLLADALAHGAKAVMTFGAVGSNHALATAAYAQKLGIAATLVLVNEPNSHDVRRNLLLDLYHKAQLFFTPTGADRAELVSNYYKNYKGQFCTFPYPIPVGGSCPRGIVGFVNAAFELKEQIDAGLLPEPKYILIACGNGSSGSTVGLMVGCKAAGLCTRIIPVAVEPEEFAGQMAQAIKALYQETIDFLAQFEPEFRNYTLDENDVQVVNDYAGTEYGLFIPEAVAAIKIMQQQEDVTLDGVYASRPLCVLLDMLKNNTNDEPVLFWNTFCGDPFTELISHVQYTDLPQEFHTYFIDDVQPLDVFVQ